MKLIRSICCAAALCLSFFSEGMLPMPFGPPMMEAPQALVEAPQLNVLVSDYFNQRIAELQQPAVNEDDAH